MKNSNQRSEEWRSAVSSQQERGRDREIAPTVSSLDGSNLRLLGFSLFRSRRFQQRVRGGPDRILRRGCR